jgi:hypothetical protein
MIEHQFVYPAVHRRVVDPQIGARDENCRTLPVASPP